VGVASRRMRPVQFRGSIIGRGSPEYNRSPNLVSLAQATCAVSAGGDRLDVQCLRRLPVRVFGRVTTLGICHFLCRFRDLESAMDAESTEAIGYSEKLLSAAIEVVGAAKVVLNSDWARNPKIVCLSILCRSISNFRAAILLIQQGHVMEARALGRCLYENLLWIGALRERGLDFVQDMLKDEAFNRQSLAELTLRLSKKQGADVNSPDSLTLRSIIKDVGKRFPDSKKLNASKTAAEGAVETAYIEYARLSLDGVHCSVMGLGRHLSRERVAENHTEIVVSVEARTSDAEMLSTILHSCRALIGVAVGANEILGFTTASNQLGAMVTELEANGWARSDPP
jgi:hypothetical protein